mgnify:CR=1 FL=1
MRIQTDLEEQFNAFSHAFGALLGIAGLVLLLVFNSQKTEYSTFSVIIYGVSIIILFSASALYHLAKTERKKHYYRVLDHISIYILIAGTYTPVLLIALEASLGWPLFWVVWGLAFFGAIKKIFFTGRFEAFSVILYLAMGWLVVFDFQHLHDMIGTGGIIFLLAGGLAYTGGIIFYAIERIPYNHVIWHFFVLAGAICHFFMVFGYII